MTTDGRPTFWSWIGFGGSLAVFVCGIVSADGGILWLRILGVACLLLSPLFYLPPFILLRRHGRPDPGRPFHETNRLVDHGLYAVVRHPQYVGYMLLTAGFAALVQHLAVSVLALIALYGHHRQAMDEEADARVRFGPEYDAYAARTPRYDVVRGLLRLLARRFWQKPLRLTVAVAHAPDPGQPLIVRGGDRLRWERRPTQWEGWLWCEAPNGHDGWVPETYVELDGDECVLQRDYDARELAVPVGETVTVLEAVSGWAFVRTAAGAHGWVPLRCLRS